jgi:hypothetical protein
MSYTRFGWDDSDVYIFMSSRGWLECRGCILKNGWQYHSTDAMVTHLQEHVAAGHSVPMDVIPALRRDDTNNFSGPAANQGGGT